MTKSYFQKLASYRACTNSRKGYRNKILVQLVLKCYVSSSILSLILSIVSAPAYAQQYRCSDISLGNNVTESESYNHQNNYRQVDTVDSSSGSDSSYSQQNGIVNYDRSRTGKFENENSGSFRTATVDQQYSNRARAYNRGGGGNIAATIPVKGVPLNAQLGGSGYTQGSNNNTNSSFNSRDKSGTFDRDQRGYNTQNDFYSGDRSSINQNDRTYNNFRKNNSITDRGFQRGGRNFQSTVVAGNDCRDVNHYLHQDKKQKLNKSYEHRNSHINGHRNANQRGRDSLNQFMRY